MNTEYRTVTSNELVVLISDLLNSKSQSDFVTAIVDRKKNYYAQFCIVGEYLYSELVGNQNLDKEYQLPPESCEKICRFDWGLAPHGNFEKQWSFKEIAIMTEECLEILEGIYRVPKKDLMMIEIVQEDQHSPKKGVPTWIIYTVIIFTVIVAILMLSM